MPAGVSTLPGMDAPARESVWDYPRPPRLDRAARPVRVEHAGATLAASSRAWRVLETSHPPTYYVPWDDVTQALLVPVAVTSFCEWKGQATYFDIVVPGAPRVQRAAWAYLRPSAPFTELAGAVAFYAGLVDRCLVGDELALPQPGGFYGGWVTSDLDGPFKGEPGSEGW